MRVVVTGATSFVGRFVCAALAAMGHTVTGTYRHAPRRPAPLRYSLLPVDFADSATPWPLPDDTEAIVHVAGVSVTGPDDDAANMLAVNVNAALRLRDWAIQRNVRCLIYTSTLSVHGRIEAPSVSHDTPIQAPDVYGASKYLGERLFAETAGALPTVALRLPGVLGPGAHRAFLPRMLETVRAGQPVTLFNPEGPFNNAAHVADLAALIDRILHQELSGFDAFPVGAAGMTTIRGVAERLMSGAGRTVDIVEQPATGSSFTIDSRRAIERYGYDPQDIGAMVERYGREG